MYRKKKLLVTFRPSAPDLLAAESGFTIRELKDMTFPTCATCLGGKCVDKKVKLLP